MNWDAIGAVGEIIGAIAVVATLVYLAAQIKHSANQSTASLSATVLNENSRMQELLIAEPHAAETLLKLKTGEILTPVEEIRADSIANRFATHWFQIELNYQRGLVEEMVYRTYCRDVARTAKLYPGIKQKFVELAHDYPEGATIPILTPMYE